MLQTLLKKKNTPFSKVIKSVMSKTNINTSLRKFLNLSPNCICRLSVLLLYYHLHAIGRVHLFFWQHNCTCINSIPHLWQQTEFVSCNFFNTLQSSYSNKQCQCLQFVHVMQFVMQNGHMKRVKKKMLPTDSSTAQCIQHAAIAVSRISILIIK